MRGLLLGLLLFTASCQTFTLRDGKKYRQFAPAKDKASGEYDTSIFIKKPFELIGYSNKTGFYKNKRIITAIEGDDVEQFAGTGGKYYIYFYNPTCASACESIKKLEEKFNDKENVILISYREEYDAIDNRLTWTKFAQYPYYVLANKKRANILLLKQRDFIKEACSNCYDKYKDEVAFAEYFIIQNGTIEPVMLK
jgi:hypothetical protein